MKTLIFTLLFLCLSSFQKSEAADFQSSVFSIKGDDCPYLHTHLQGRGWYAENAQESDQPFLESIFMNNDLMKWFGAGSSSNEQDVYNRTLKLWLPRFEQGYPHGGLIIREPLSHAPIGFIMGGFTPVSGAAGLAYVLIPDFQGKGLGSGIVHEFITKWAPEVARIGRGDGINHQNIINNFNCFGGTFLNRLLAFVSPDNISSLRLLEKNGFYNAPLESEPLLDMRSFPHEEAWNEEDSPLENLITTHLSSLSSLEKETGYTLIDKQGQRRFFILPHHHDHIKYQLELSITSD